MGDPFEMVRDWDDERDALIDEMAARRARQVVSTARPWHERGLSVATMSQREFAEWCDAGRPALAPPREVMPPRNLVDAVVSAALTVEQQRTRQHVERRITGALEAIAEEELRAEFARRLELAQAAHEMDLAALRQELAEARQPERRRATHPRGSNGHVAPARQQ